MIANSRMKRVIPGILATSATEIHSLEGALAGAQYLEAGIAASLLDIGCGTGTWMRAALELGVGEVFGLDFADFNGVTPPPAALTDAARPAVDSALIRRHDLRKPFDLGRKFDVALCFDWRLASYLADGYAPNLSNPYARSDLIYFSAACPRQRGGRRIMNPQCAGLLAGTFQSQRFRLQRQHQVG